MNVKLTLATEFKSEPSEALVAEIESILALPLPAGKGNDYFFDTVTVKVGNFYKSHRLARRVVQRMFFALGRASETV